MCKTEDYRLRVQASMTCARALDTLPGAQSSKIDADVISFLGQGLLGDYLPSKWNPSGSRDGEPHENYFK